MIELELHSWLITVKTVEHKWTRTDAKEIKLENGYSVKLEETSLRQYYFNLASLVLSQT